ncbi:Vps62-related protein [Oleisolibacter albus]|uniref:Vps62-related protein n=1 Tax=Oleisolibacter albus TaxID=2171757 RepID=UPI000DF343A6|nr:Vps62-related protein [Oleisolibacter albus]
MSDGLTPASFTMGGLIFCYTSTFDKLWSTDSIHYGADNAGSFWKPVPPSGFQVFGSFCHGSTNDPNGNRAVLCAQMTTDGTALPPFANPTGFALLWTDKSTGYHPGNGACWTMQAPDGYVALGAVFNNTGDYSAPNIQDYLCVRADLAPTIGQSVQIWDDQGTGSTFGDLACYAVLPPPAGQSTQVASGTYLALSPGVFVANSTYNDPIVPTPVLLLPLTIHASGTAATPPAMTGPTDPVVSAVEVRAYSIEVPFTAVTDTNDGYAMDWKLANPVYRIERYDSFQQVGQWDNQSTASPTKTYSITTGVSQQTSSQWSANVGVQLSGSDKGKESTPVESESVTLSVSLSVSFALQFASTDIFSESVTESMSVQVPANSFFLIWQSTSAIKIRRPNDTFLSDQLSVPLHGKAMQQFDYTTGTVVDPYPST